MNIAAGGRTTLETWKAIAAFFQRDERTVKRWEVERGLPVRRLPGKARSRIYADVAELERWLLGGSGSAAPAAGGAQRETTVRRPTVRPAWRSPSHRANAQRHYLRGLNGWRARTPDSLTRAVDEFRAALAADPSYAEAHAGLANCYNLMREYTLMRPGEAYPLAKAEAERALALEPDLPEAQAALAFVKFYWEWDATASERLFEGAIALDPAWATAHHWFATSLLQQGRFIQAIAEIEQAAALDPTSLAIAADRAVVFYFAGRRSDGLSALRALAHAHPEFLPPHRQLARIALLDGPDSEFLTEARRVATLMHDRQRLAAVDAAAAGHQRAGRRGMLADLMQEQERQLKLGVVGPYQVAVTAALLGERAAAMSYLELAFARREEELTGLAIDPAFVDLQASPAFRRLAAPFAQVNAAAEGAAAAS